LRPVRSLRFGTERLGPADLVTSVRAAVVVAVGVLVTISYVGPAATSAIVTLASIALVLDAFDGWVARCTRTVTQRGARYDMEVDAALILVLSVYVAQTIGPWVLAIGLARYAVLVAGLAAPWLRGRVPTRFWRKCVAATQGIVLTFAAAEAGPRLLRLVALTVSLVLLAISFGTEIWELRRLHAGPLSQRTRRAVGWSLTTFAFLLVWFALVAPDRLGELTPLAFIRIPGEGLVLVAVVLALPQRSARVLAVLGGLVLAVLTTVKFLDMGFVATLDRPFDPVNDWGYFGPGSGVLSDSLGRHWAAAAEVGALLAVLALLVLLPLALVRLTRLAGRHREGSARAVGALAVVWIVSAAFHVQVAGGTPLAATSAAGVAVDQIERIQASIGDRREFGAQLAAADGPSTAPAGQLLTGLRGKDVLVVFVESYGRVAVQGTPYSPNVDRTLQQGTAALQAAGFGARSAFLRSPTFGGLSWLAHSTLESGLWVDSQQRYDQLVASNRFTLSDAFGRAGWRTFVASPANTMDWPQGRSFYHFDHVYGGYNIGYKGPDFGYATIPDEYTLSALNRLEFAKRDRPPLMAEIDLVSSHTPWARLPHLVDWNAVKDGKVFKGMPDQVPSPAETWQSSAGIRAAYSKSIQYSMQSLVSFVQHAHDKNLVMVVLGDHQPATVVSGTNASHDVPVSIIAHDPAVLDRIRSWQWQDGLLPAPNARVWPMDSFRNRFLSAYRPGPAIAVASH
jgi:phosphatidylglycerophosphate synthase